MIIVYVDQILPRISYALDFIFTARGYNYELTTDRTRIEDNSNTLIYTQGQMPGNWIPMSTIMCNEGVEDLEVGIGMFGKEECFSFDGIIDPIGSVFYHLTRYEEYVSKEVDEHERFPFSASQAPESWIELAKSDRWAEEILNFSVLEKRSDSTSPSLIPTFDIDNTYAFSLKTGKRKILSIFKDLLTFNFTRLKARRSVLHGAIDPYDTFDKIKAIGKRFPKSRMFWLNGKWGKYDRNINIEIAEHQSLIQSMKLAGLSIGLHPSYGSFNSSDAIANEKKLLETVLDSSITASRQHFLRFTLPKTYQTLEAIGFKDEYTMGYAERVGFRCGTSRPHAWFDLSANRSTELIIHPFVYMDGTLREYMTLTIDESKQKINQLYKELERYGGEFVFIWHNETIGDYGNWSGWSEVLKYTLNLENESN